MHLIVLHYTHYTNRQWWIAIYGSATVTPLGRGYYNSQQCTNRHTVEYGHLA